MALSGIPPVHAGTSMTFKCAGFHQTTHEGADVNSTGDVIPVTVKSAALRKSRV